MCNPMFLGIAAGVGTLFNVYSTISNSQAQASALKVEAAAARDKGYSDELDLRAQARTKLASQLAALSDRGVSVSTGSPLDLLRASARNQEIDALRIRADGLNKYNAKRYQASGILKAGLLTAGGQLLSGAASAGALAGLGSVGTAASKTVEAGRVSSLAGVA